MLYFSDTMTLYASGQQPNQRTSTTVPTFSRPTFTVTAATEPDNKDKQTVEETNDVKDDFVDFVEGLDLDDLDLEGR